MSKLRNVRERQHRRYFARLGADWLVPHSTVDTIMRINKSGTNYRVWTPAPGRKV